MATQRENEEKMLMDLKWREKRKEVREVRVRKYKERVVRFVEDVIASPPPNSDQNRPSNF